MFHDVNKRNPKIDFLISAVLAMFWLAGAAAWANGLTGLRWAVTTENWLHYSSICRSVHTGNTWATLVADRGPTGNKTLHSQGFCNELRTI